MKALEESALLNSTVVFFLSDHGMPLPFAKTQLYHHSTNTPLIVSWPGVTKPGSVNDSFMVSAIDLLPTFLSIAEIKNPDSPNELGSRGIQGSSFLPIIKGSSKSPVSGVIFKEYNENSGGVRNPMRGVQTTQYLYLFNPWSNGKRTMATATNGTATWKRMLVLASKNEAIRKRVNVMRYRTVEELYNTNNDPDCLHNLAESREHQKTIKDLRQALHDWMKATGDHAITAFAGRNDPEKMESYVKTVQDESDLRRKNKRKKKRKSKA